MAIGTRAPAIDTSEVPKLDRYMSPACVSLRDGSVSAPLYGSHQVVIRPSFRRVKRLSLSPARMRSSANTRPFRSPAGYGSHQVVITLSFRRVERLSLSLARMRRARRGFLGYPGWVVESVSLRPKQRTPLLLLITLEA
jgi:hypothetical protein